MIRNKYIDWVRRKIVRVGYKDIKVDFSKDELSTIKRAADPHNMNIHQYCEMAIEVEMINHGVKEEKDRKWTHDFIYK